MAHRNGLLEKILYMHKGKKKNPPPNCSPQEYSEDTEFSTSVRNLLVRVASH